MAKFRKKPVVIEAFEVHSDDGKTRRLPPQWLIDAMMNNRVVQTTERTRERRPARQDP